MSFQLYKEGQGTWARGTLAFVVGATGIFAAVRGYGFLETENLLAGELVLPFIGWGVGWRELIALVILLPFGVAGIWLYNTPKLADFLVDTEGELKNKVTWPTQKETMNNSAVVVVTCVLLGLWVVFADLVFGYLKDFIYGIGAFSDSIRPR